MIKKPSHHSCHPRASVAQTRGSDTVRILGSSPRMTEVGTFIALGFFLLSTEAWAKKSVERISLDSSSTFTEDALEVAHQNNEEKKIMLQNQVNSLNYSLEGAQLNSQKMKQESREKTKALGTLISQFYVFCQDAFFSFLMRETPADTLLHVKILFERALKEGRRSLVQTKESLEHSLQLEKTIVQEREKCSLLLHKAQEEAKNITNQRFRQIEALSKKYQSLAGGDNAYGMALEMPALGTLLPPSKKGKNPGIKIETAFGAKVSSPTYGTVSYVGKWGRSSQALIIDHGGGYHSILSHLESFFVSVGKTLYPGEEVGQMAGYGKKRPVLAFEFRGPQGPLDPLAGLRRAGLR